MKYESIVNLLDRVSHVALDLHVDVVGIGVLARAEILTDKKAKDPNAVLSPDLMELHLLAPAARELRKAEVLADLLRDQIHKAMLMAAVDDDDE